MKGYCTVLFIFLAVVSWTCKTDNPVILPDIRPILIDVDPVPDVSKPIMEGIYSVVTGKERFGDQVVLKWNRKNVSLFSQNNYTVLATGYTKGSIILKGFWRVPTSDETGLSAFAILPAEGANEILAGISTPNITIRGKYDNGDKKPSKDFVLQFKRPFSANVVADTFYIVGHRGGGRTSDRLPVSENSIPMVAFTGNLGSNGIEIDIRMTKDKVPVLYHDDDINIRLTVKGPINGEINDFTYAQLFTFVRLIRGERIPKLEEALKYVVDSTDLKFVWLDMKEENREFVETVVSIQKASLTRAQAIPGRQLEILMGVPTENLSNVIKTFPDFELIPTLSELTTDNARDLGSRAWAPRWTQGTQNDLVDQIHAEGRIALCWTIDVAAFIQQYLQEGHFDGLLSNYPSLVAYYYYMRE